MQTKKLRLAVVGCGAIFHNNHLPALRKSTDWEIAFLVDNDHKRIRKVAKDLFCGFSDKPEDIPDNIDACLIATPNFLHAQQSILLLNKGFHVICEKPMALNMQEAESIKECAEKKGKYFFIVHQKRFQPNFIFFKQKYLLKEKMKSVDLSLGNEFGWVSRTNFYHSPEKAGGGVFIDLGVHLLDILVSMTDSIDINEIVFSAPVLTNPVIDTAATCFGVLDNTVPFSLRVSRLAELNNSVRICFENTEYEFSLDNPNSLSVQCVENANNKKIDFETGENADPFYLFWQNVANVILNRQITVRPSMIEDGLKVMRCIEKARDTGRLLLI